MSIWKKWREATGLNALDYPVPTYANSFWYSLGGITFICFAITAITGVILTQFYNPSPQIANASVRYISSTPGLKLVRALHYWSANIGFVLLITHMLRVLFTGAFRPPRTITYIVGVLLLITVFQIFFTGTVLKWDQEGYEALEHFVAVNKLLGPFGAIFQEDFTLSTSMLARLYSLHVGVLPILLLLFFLLHIFYVKHFGIAPKPYQNQEDYNASLSQGATFTQHANGLLKFGLLLLIILFGLAFFFQPRLLQAPKAGIEVTKPPWLFWIFYPLENAMGIPGILVGSVALLTGLILIPVLGVTLADEKKLLRVVKLLVVFGLIVWAALMVKTYFSPVMKHIM